MRIAAGMTTDRRRHVRRQVQIAATIVIDDGTKRLPGTIRDISAGGARVLSSEAAELPEHFYMLVPEHALQDCRVVWREPGCLGLSFEA